MTEPPGDDPYARYRPDGYTQGQVPQQQPQYPPQQPTAPPYYAPQQQPPQYPPQYYRRSRRGRSAIGCGIASWAWPGSSS